MYKNALVETAAENEWFDTIHLREGLKNRSIQGGMSTMASQVILFLMTTAQTVVLARLLLPEDYGLIAMVSSITGFITIFKDLGLSAAIIQKEKLTQAEVSSTFWLNILISLAVSLLIALSAPMLARFYEEKRLFEITLVFALNVFVVGLSLQHNALMKRQMRFHSLAVIQTSTVAVNLLAGIVLAWLGFGYWALVIQSVVLAVLQTVILWVVCSWRPNFMFNKSDISYFLRFGVGITGFDFVNYFSRNMDNVLIGKFVGSVALGLYAKAYQLLMLPITQLRNPLNSVAIPALSSLQNDTAEYKRFYFRYLFILAFFSMPMIIYLGVFAKELILILLGENWVGAAFIFQLLAISAFIQPVSSTPSLVLITTGDTKRHFIMGSIGAFFMVVGFGIGVYLDGVRGVAIAQAVVGYVLFIPALLYNLRKTFISSVEFLQEISLPFIFSLVSGLGMITYVYFIKKSDIYFSHIFHCIVGFLVGAVIYLSLMLLFSYTRRRLASIVDMVATIKRKK